MNHKILALIVIVGALLIILFSSTPIVPQTPSASNNGLSGATGSVEFGTGSCFPCACNGDDCSGCPAKNYSPYNGELVFIFKNKLDTLGNGNFDALRDSSPKTSVVSGQYSINVPVGEYVVMPPDVYQYAENFITVETGQIASRDFSFYKCTNY